VEDDVDFVRPQQVRHLVPVALREDGLDLEVLAETRSQVDFEARHLGRVVVPRKHVRTATLLIATPKERSALSNLVERVGSKRLRREGEDESTYRQKKDEDTKPSPLDLPPRPHTPSVRANFTMQSFSLASRKRNLRDDRSKRSLG